MVGTRIFVIAMALWFVTGCAQGGSDSSAASNEQKAIPTPLVTPTPNPFEVGVAIHLDAGPGIEKIHVMGAKWVRIDMNWNIMEPKKGQWNFSIFDEVIAKAKQQGLKIFATLAYTPDWANQNDHPDGNGIPKEADWTNFVRVAVKRYKADVQHFGIWNEPNLDTFWSGSADQFVKTILRPAYQTIKSIDPQLKVLGPELSHMYTSTISMQSFYDAIRKNNCTDCIDIVTHHIYAGDDLPEKLMGYSLGGVVYKDGLKQLLNRAGITGKPVWLTEIGVDAAKTGEAEQQRFILAQLKYLSTAGWIQSTFIYELTDDPSTGWGYGLLRKDLSPRPYFFGIQDFLKNL